jgi:hypothetical protein
MSYTISPILTKSRSFWLSLTKQLNNAQNILKMENSGAIYKKKAINFQTGA